MPSYFNTKKSKLVIHIIIGLNPGGAETSLHRLIALSNKANLPLEHKVLCLTKPGLISEKLLADRIAIKYFGLSSVTNLVPVLFSLYRYIRKFKPDIVQTWMYHSDLFGGIISRLAGVPVIIWSVRSSFIKFSSPPATIIIKYLCAIFSYSIPTVITYVAEFSAHCHESFGYDKNKRFLLPNYVPDIFFQDYSHYETSFLPSSIQNSNRIIGFVGRAATVKGYDIFLKMIPMLAKEFSDLHFVMAGKRIKESDAIRSFIEKFDLYKYVSLYPHQSDVIPFLRSLDILCLPSLSEGFPNILAEAMALEVSVCSFVAGDSEKIVSSFGTICPESSYECLAKCLRSMLITDQNILRNNQINGSLHIKSHWCESSSLSLLNSLYSI